MGFDKLGICHLVNYVLNIDTVCVFLDAKCESFFPQFVVVHISYILEH